MSRFCGNIRTLFILKPTNKAMRHVIFLLLICFPMLVWGQLNHPFLEETLPLTPALGTWAADLEVEEYELLEVGVRLDAALQLRADSFIDASMMVDPVSHQPVYDVLGSEPGLNPYDPAEMDLFAEFTSPEGKSYRVNGFYYQEFENRADTSGWDALPTDFKWRLRFAPVGVGDWTVRFGYRDQGGDEIWTGGFGFACVANQRGNPGFVEIGPSGYYLQFSGTQELFMPYGINIGTAAKLPNGMHVGPNYDTYWYFKERMDSLRREGANLMRLRIAPIQYGFEWERLGNYHPRQNLSWQLDQIVSYAQETGIYILMTGIFEGMEAKPSRVNWSAGNRHHPYSWYEDSLLWLDESVGNVGDYANRAYYGNPYNKYLIGQSSDEEYDLDPFWDSPEVMRYARNRVRYAVARWGWSPAVADLTVSSEWETFEKPEFQDDAAEIWFAEVYPKWFPWLISLTEYLDELDHFHLVGNSQGTDVLSVQKADSSFAYYDFGDDFWAPDVNMVVHVNPYGSWPYRNYWFTKRVQRQRRHHKPIWWAETGLSYKCEDVERLCILEDRVSFHNNLWAMSMSGAVPPCHFWGERIFAYQLFHIYRPLVEFFEGEDLHERLYEPALQHYHPLFLDWNSSPEDREYVAVNDTNLVECFALRAVDDQRILGWVHNRTVDWVNFPAYGNDLKFPRAGHYAHFDYDPPVPPTDYVPEYRPAVAPTVTISGLPKQHRYELELWATVGEGGMIEMREVSTDKKGQLVLAFPDLTGALDSSGYYDPGAFAFKLNSLEETVPELLQSFEVFPNPGGDELGIHLFLYEEAPVEVAVYDSRGRLVRQVELGLVQRAAGRVDTRGLAPGIYWVRASTGEYSWTRKWICLR